MSNVIFYNLTNVENRPDQEGAISFGVQDEQGRLYIRRDGKDYLIGQSLDNLTIGNTQLTETDLITLKNGTGGFVAQTTPPDNTALLWIDTNPDGGLKYNNGSEWVTVPVRFS